MGVAAAHCWPRALPGLTALGIAILLASCTGRFGTPSQSPNAACRPAASSTYASGLAPGQISIRTESVETTSQVLVALRKAGFSEVAIIRTATPWKLQLIRESDGDFQARVYWRLPGVPRLAMLQTCSIKFPSAGSSVMIRGYSGYREGTSFYWSERRYELVMDPGTSSRFALIEWRSTA